eukprot:SAG31_NODE_13993_length_833_cov_0.893733_1_plen_235_part_00
MSSMSLGERARLMQAQRAQPLQQRRAVVEEAAKTRRAAAIRSDLGQTARAADDGCSSDGGIVLLHSDNAPTEMIRAQRRQALLDHSTANVAEGQLWASTSGGLPPPLREADGVGRANSADSADVHEQPLSPAHDSRPRTLSDFELNAEQGAAEDEDWDDETPEAVRADRRRRRRQLLREPGGQTPVLINRSLAKPTASNDSNGELDVFMPALSLHATLFVHIAYHAYYSATPSF